jgi:hypothetical protein
MALAASPKDSAAAVKARLAAFMTTSSQQDRRITLRPALRPAVISLSDRAPRRDYKSEASESPPHAEENLRAVFEIALLVEALDAV